MHQPAASNISQVEPDRTHVVWRVGLVAALVLLGQTVLAAFLVAAAVTLAMGPRTRRPAALWLPVGLVLLLALLNSMKWPESDLANYYDYVDQAARSPLAGFLADSDTFLSIKPTEFTFRLLTWLVAWLGGGSHALFSFVVTTLVYGCALASCLLLLPARAATKAEAGRDSRVAVAAFAALAVGLTFSLTGHLIRQYLAGGLFTLSVVAWAVSGRRLALAGALVACTLHNSAAAMLLPLTLAIAYRRSLLLFLVGIAALVAASMTDQVSTLLQLSEQFSFEGDGGQQPIALLLLDLALLLAALLANRRTSSGRHPDKPAVHVILAFAVATAALLLSLREAPFLLFRLYMYAEFLRAPLLALLLYAFIGWAGSLRRAATLSVLVASLTLLALRAGTSEWHYLPEVDPLRALSLPGVVDRWSSVERQ